MDTLGPSKAGRSPDLDALAAYVASLDATPASPYAADPAGEALFSTLGCDACHAPPLYTDSMLGTAVRHDVGTIVSTSGSRLGEPLDGFDTPTLLGAWATAPYLHDGRAPTLEEAIDAHQGVDVPEADLASVAAFVRSL
jgi:cytochrome c peroxidase